VISEKQVEQALDYLRDNCEEAAQARAESHYMEQYRKSLKAIIMKEHVHLPVAAQEREAYADPRMIAHLDVMRHADYVSTKHLFMRQSAEAKIQAWQTQSANNRTMEKIR
jgi:hypothetical protein